MYKLMVYLIATVHIILMIINIVSLPLLIIYQPIFVWMPILTLMVSPLLGGTFCMFNDLENHFREKAGMPLIIDRLRSLLGVDK